MKYLAIVLLFTGCASAQKSQTYECAIFNAHGVYVHLKAGAHNVEEANAIAQTVADRLAAKQVIPPCGAMCELEK